MKTAICLLLLVLGDVATCKGAIWVPAPERGTHCFAGTVAELKQQPGHPQYNLATVVVREVWRGDIADTVTVMTESNRCGAWLEPGDDCVFVATDPDRPDPGRSGRFRPGAGDPGRARLLYVTEGDYELYVRCSPWQRERWGVPIRVANGQASREPMLDDLIAILADERIGDREYAAKLLDASTQYVLALARSPEAADRQRFDHALAIIVRALMDAHGQPGITYDYLLRTLDNLRFAACSAVPVMLAFQSEVGADVLGMRYFHALLSADGYDSQVLRRKAEVLASTKSPELREFILWSTWHGPYNRPREKPQPAEYVRDSDPKVRETAIMTLSMRTVDRDSLVALAHLALGDSVSDVAEHCLPLLIGSLDDERALSIALAGLEHRDERVAIQVFWAATRESRGWGLRCATLKSALKSKHWYVRMSALEYRTGDGAGCG